MKRERGSPALIAILSVLAAGITTCTGQQPEFVRAVTIGDDYFGLAIRAGTNGWVGLDWSADLRSWTELASIATTNDVRLFVDEVTVRAGPRFYRLRLSGTTAEEAEARWALSRKLPYRFQIQRVSTSRLPYVLTGIVTVVNGQKTVSEATADGQALASVDLSDFPSMEELFALLQAAQAAGCRQVYALYDPTLGFPFRCLIDQRAAAIPPADTANAVEYRISQLEFLATGQMGEMGYLPGRRMAPQISQIPKASSSINHQR